MASASEEALLSKFAIGDLAIRSALQLEKARAHRGFSPEPLRRLAAALQQTSFPASPSSAASLRPGYYEPLSRLSVVGLSNIAGSDISHLLDWAVGGLIELADHDGFGERSDELVEFCNQLHDEFVGRPAAEARFGRPGTVTAPAGVG